VQQKALADLKSVWAALCDLESRMLVDPGLRSFHKNLCWPLSPWVRETFIALSEYDFKYIPKEVQESVDAFLGRPGQTKLCEDLIG